MPTKFLDEHILHRVERTAQAAVTKRRIQKLNGSDHALVNPATANDAPFGVSLNDAVAGESVQIQLQGNAVIDAGGNIAVNDEIVADANGILAICLATRWNSPSPIFASESTNGVVLHWCAKTRSSQCSGGPGVRRRVKPPERPALRRSWSRPSAKAKSCSRWCGAQPFAAGHTWSSITQLLVLPSRKSARSIRPR